MWYQTSHLISTVTWISVFPKMSNFCFKSYDMCHCVIWAICHLSLDFFAVDNYYLHSSDLQQPFTFYLKFIWCIVPPVHSMKETFHFKVIYSYTCHYYVAVSEFFRLYLIIYWKPVFFLSLFYLFLLNALFLKLYWCHLSLHASQFTRVVSSDVKGECLELQTGSS